MEAYYFYSDKQNNSKRYQFISKLQKLLRISDEDDTKLWKTFEIICSILEIPINRLNKEKTNVTAPDWNVHTSPTIIIKENYYGEEYCRFWGDTLDINEIQKTLIDLVINK